MDISVIMPSYNSAAFIGEALDSVKQQSYPVAEVLVIDDGSTDNAREIASNYPFVKLIQQNHRGPSAARNTGVRVAKGELIAFLDSDDLWYPTAMADQVKALTTYPDAAFVFATLWGLPYPATLDGELRDRYWPKELSAWLKKHSAIDGMVFGDVYPLLLRANCVNTSSVVARRAQFVEAGIFDESMNHGEDHDMWLRLARRWPAVFMADSQSRYRIHGGSISGIPEARQELFHRATIKVLTKHRSEFSSGAASSALANAYNNYGLFQLKNGNCHKARQLTLQGIRTKPTPDGIRLYLEAAFPKFYSWAASLVRDSHA